MNKKLFFGLTESQIQKHKKGICITLFCRKKTTHNKRICPRCNKRKQKENNPIKLQYWNKKYNAKKKGKQFNLSYEYFEKMAIESGYDKNSGSKSSNALTIDRIDNTKGYEEGNVRIITRLENTYKRNFIDF